MSAAARAGAAAMAGEAIAEGVARMERRAARARPVLGAAMLVAALSLAATIYFLIQTLDLTEQLEETNGRLAQAVAERDAALRQVAEAGRVLANDRAPAAERAAAREVVSELAGAAPATVLTPADSPPALSAPPQLLTLGVATGWDVDIFWCAGAGEAANYAAGRAAALALARVAASAQTIAPGTQLGRIRLRPISPADSGVWRGAMNGRSLLVVWDSGRGEEAAAQAVRDRLPSPQTAATLDQGTLPGNQAPSRWYLSVISCAAR